jgi:hypothetical protein
MLNRLESCTATRDRPAIWKRRRCNPNDFLSNEEEVGVVPARATPLGLFAGALRVNGRDRVSRARFRLCRETTRVPARARQSQNVPVSYPRGLGMPIQFGARRR